MIEYLKDLFGGGALTFEEFSGKLEKAEGVKLANLKEGGYVGRDKFDALGRGAGRAEKASSPKPAASWRAMTRNGRPRRRGCGRKPRTR